MTDKLYGNDHICHTNCNKRQYPIEEIQSEQTHAKRMKSMRIQKIQEKKRKREEHNTFRDLETAVKRHCLNIERKHSYLSASHGMVYFTPRIYKTYERVI